MAWAQEIIDFAMKAMPLTTVNEYQTGLYFLIGKVLTWKIPESKLIEILEERKRCGRGRQITIDEIIAEEEKMRLDTDKTGIKNYMPWVRPDVPEYWHKSIFGRPQHPERYSKNLPHGMYLHIPTFLPITRIEVVPTKEVVKDMKFISVATLPNPLTEVNGEDIRRLLKIPNDVPLGNDGAVTMFFSGFIRYQIEDGYKAYTQVQDWEKSYQSQALLVLSKLVRGYSLFDWVDPKRKLIEDIEERFKDKLNTTGPTREDWGIWTAEFALTDVVPHKLVRNVQEVYLPEEGVKLLHDKLE